jgi:valyl-tRNA synthetase
VCTFGDLADVVWWRDLGLPTRAVVGRDGRLLPEVRELGGLTVPAARRRVVELLRESGDLVGDPRPVTHPVKFYEKGEQPLEIVVTRQWYLRNGGRDAGLREALLARGRELHWVPAHMRTRYEHWLNGLTGDWLVSRQRYFGVPIPVWYPLDGAGEPDYAHPLLPDENQLPVDPAGEPPPGYSEADRGRPGGFAGDPDVMDTWATSSLTPQLVSGWERDPDLFLRVFPMDLRPQGQEIIRTWLFGSVVRAHLEQGALPWRTAVLSGWILDPDRKKMSKSTGEALTPLGLLDRYGSDAVRYWAACGRPGTDLAFDDAQMRVGRRLATKLLNASRFVLGTGAGAGAAETPLDRAMLASLSTVVGAATAAFERYDHTSALSATEAFFWTFCDDYIELVKGRAYGGDPSARTALAEALSVQLRLFAPFLPFVTEEIWSWWQPGSVHRAPWPPVSSGDGGLAGDLLALAAGALGQVRRAKSGRRLSMRAEVPVAVASGPIQLLDRLSLVERDLRAAGRIAELDLRPDGTTDLTIECRF